MPDQTFDEKMVLELGEERIELLHLGPTHSPGDIVVWLSDGLVEATDSEWGERILDDYRTFLPKFWLVKPKAADLGTLIESLRQAA